MPSTPTLAATSPSLLTLLLAGCSTTAATQPPVADPPPAAVVEIVYPQTPRGDVVDEYHGVRIADPYRWLEDTDAPSTRRWIEEENAITEAWLSRVPARASIHERVEALWDYGRFGLPRKRAGQYFFSYDDGKTDQDVLCRQRSLSAEPEVVLDPNLFSEDGTVSLGGTAISEDARYLAYGLSDGGSDWRTWRVRDLESGEDLPETLEWVKFSAPTWTHDNAGFFYSRYPETDDRLQAETSGQRLFYHRVGTPQSEDVLVHEEPEHPRRGFGTQITEDGRLLLIVVWEGSERKNRLYVRDLATPDAPIVRVLDEFDASYDPVGNDGLDLWLRTDKDAPRGRVVRIDASQPGAALTEVVPEQQETLQGVSVVGGRFLATYLADARTRVRAFDLEGAPLGDVALPGLGTATGFDGRSDDPETFFSFGSYTTPSTVYRYDVATGERTVFRRPEVAFDPDAYVTEQVFYESKDGTRIPMFITRGRDLEGKQPTVLYGYGGFNISLQPRFSPAIAAWLDMGGTYAVANLRGGGEYGRAWHEAGTLGNKQNVFDDFIAAAEWLIDSGYTSRNQLAISGGSNGGLLVGACMTQRPDLFAAALPAVGVLDMLRYHEFTIGWAWASDYGTSDDEEMFPVLRAYSPLHNVREGVSYPATLITTGDHDDRVVPGHSFKFAAALQAAHEGSTPVLIRIETRAGHGAGKSTSQAIDETSDQWTFLAQVLGMSLPGAERGATAP